MILDNLSNAHNYLAIHPSFKKAFEFLREFDCSKAEEGRIEIDENIYAIYGENSGKGKDASKLEAHRKYIDIQYIAEGADCMGWEYIPAQKEDTGYDSEKDFILYEDTPSTWINVTKGCFAVFFPEDAHAPLAGTENMKKVVVKVKVD